MAIKTRKRKTTTKKKTRKRTNENTLPSTLLPSGCTLLNCAFADNPFGAYRKGTTVNIIGDSSAGKSILAYTSMAAMASYEELSEYRFIRDDPECSESFDIENLFGKKLASRMEPPGWAKNKDGDVIPRHSETVQDFHMFVKDAVNKGKPFVYILDSWDAVDSEEDKKHADEMYKKWKKDESSEKGTYGTAKAKMASTILRNVTSDINKTNSLVIIVSQVRENLNAGTFGSKKTRSGGKALKHYSWQELWLVLSKKIKHSATNLQQGVHSIAKMGKNRQTGKLREIEFPIYYDIGIDDVAANIAFLASMNFFKKNKQTYTVPELDFVGTKQNMIIHVEDNNLEKELQKLVGEAWMIREKEAKLERKRRFK